MSVQTFKDLGLKNWIIALCEKINYKSPTDIQKTVIPAILKGKNVIANAETGSGKTAAFAFPILAKLSEDPYGIFALILTPNRELAYQINEQLSLFGEMINLKSICVTGGQDLIQQRISFDRLPHIIVGTPGRIFEQISTSDVLQKYLANLKFLVFDEADRLFEPTQKYFVDKIAAYQPSERQTIFTTATIDDNLLDRSQVDPLITHKKDQVELIRRNNYNKIAETLEQKYLYIPDIVKDYYQINQLKKFEGIHMIIFFNTCKGCHFMSKVLNNLGLENVQLHSFLPQKKRTINLNIFRNEKRTILLATDVASRGQDIRTVDQVVNYDLPREYKDYVHRIGRAARGGQRGMAISLVTQHDIKLVKNIEKQTKTKMTKYELVEEEVMEEVSGIDKAKRNVELSLFEQGDDEMFKAKKKQKNRFRQMITDSNNESNNNKKLKL